MVFRFNFTHFLYACGAEQLRMMLAERVKDASRNDLRSLTEEAGFRPVRGRTYRCALHEDRNPSARLYDGHIHCFSCGRSFDAIELAKLICRGDTGHAIHWLARRYSIEPGIAPSREWFDEEAYTHAYLFRVGCVWLMEEYLAKLKALLEVDEIIRDHSDAAEPAIECDRISPLTKFLEDIQSCTERELVIVYRLFDKHAPAFVRNCIHDASTFQIALAAALFGLPQKEAA